MAVVTPVLLSRPRSWSWVQALRALPEPVRVGAATGIALVLGGVTSFGQTVLPDWISSIANSSSGWVLAVVLVVALVRTRPGWSALAGPLAFTALTLGYVAVSTLRGYPDREVFFLVMSVIVGPFVGVAAAWLRERGWRPALAAALLGGIGIGEGVFGVTVITSTSPVYWILVVAGSVALVAVVCVRRATRWRQRLVAVAGSLLLAGAFLLAYEGAPALIGLLNL